MGLVRLFHSQQQSKLAGDISYRRHLTSLFFSPRRGRTAVRGRKRQDMCCNEALHLSPRRSPQGLVVQSANKNAALPAHWKMQSSRASSRSANDKDCNAMYAELSTGRCAVEDVMFGMQRRPSRRPRWTALRSCSGCCTYGHGVRRRAATRRRSAALAARLGAISVHVRRRDVAQASLRSFVVPRRASCCVSSAKQVKAVPRGPVQVLAPASLRLMSSCNSSSSFRWPSDS